VVDERTQHITLDYFVRSESLANNLLGYAAIILVSEEKGTSVSRTCEKNTAHPIILPKPILSFSEGRNFFTKLVCSNLLSQGIAVTKIMTGRASSVVSMYL
jgi:hypothetical protein